MTAEQAIAKSANSGKTVTISRDELAIEKLAKRCVTQIVDDDHLTFCGAEPGYWGSEYPWRVRVRLTQGVR